MTIAQLVARYERGALASHELVAEVPVRLDPGDPASVLQSLPADVLPRLRGFLDDYRPGRMLASQGGSIPGPEQVEAARRWLDRVSAGWSRFSVVSER